MDVSSLIKSVKCRGALWNRHHPKYNDRDFSLVLWKEVAKENGISVETARWKWRGIRDSYRIQLRKSILAEKNGISQQHTWAYFDEMAFVNDQINVDINRRKYWPEGSVTESTRNQNGKNSSSDEDMADDEVFQARSKRSKTCHTEISHSGALLETKVNFPAEQAIRSKLDTAQSQVNCRRLSSRNVKGNNSGIAQESRTDFCVPAELCTTEFTEDTDTQLELCSATNDIDSLLYQSSDEDGSFPDNSLLRKKLKALQDDNYCFLMSILPQMKALPAKRKFLVRIKVQELLLAEVSNMENKICRFEPV